MLLPASVVAFVVIDDAVQHVGHLSVPALAALDEPAHLLTAALVLVALGVLTPGRWPRRWVRVALVASVAIDVDHLPLYAHVSSFERTGRPPTHSLLTVVVLVLGALLLRRWRAELAGAALGITLHFVRDICTGPGLPLLWPISRADARLPYGWEVAALLVAAAVAAVRLSRRERTVNLQIGPFTADHDESHPNG